MFMYSQTTSVVVINVTYTKADDNLMTNVIDAKNMQDVLKQNMERRFDIYDSRHPHCDRKIAISAN